MYKTLIVISVAFAAGLIYPRAEVMTAEEYATAETEARVFADRHSLPQTAGITCLVRKDNNSVSVPCFVRTEALTVKLQCFVDERAPRCEEDRPHD